MINFHFLNRLYLGKRLSFEELEERRLAHDNKQLVLWGYITSVDNGTLLSIRHEPDEIIIKGRTSLFNFVRQGSSPKDLYPRYIAFTSRERAESFLRSLKMDERKQLRQRDLSEYYTEVYD